MAVHAHPEPHEVEGGWNVAADTEGETELGLVGERRRVEVGRLGLHAVDPIGPDVRELADQHEIGDAEVRLRMIRRDRALVTPEELDRRPVDRVASRRLEEERADLFRRAASRQRHPCDPLPLDGVRDDRDEPVRGLTSHLAGTVADVEVDQPAVSRAEARRIAAARIACS